MTFLGLNSPPLKSAPFFFWGGEAGGERKKSTENLLRDYTVLQSWTKALGHFCVSGAFYNSHRSNPSSHPTKNVGSLYPEFFLSFNFV